MSAINTSLRHLVWSHLFLFKIHRLLIFIHVLLHIVVVAVYTSRRHHNARLDNEAFSHDCKEEEQTCGVESESGNKRQDQFCHARAEIEAEDIASQCRVAPPRHFERQLAKCQCQQHRVNYLHGKLKCQPLHVRALIYKQSRRLLSLRTDETMGPVGISRTAKRTSSGMSH